jgi:hypothetical protein
MPLFLYYAVKRGCRSNYLERIFENPHFVMEQLAQAHPEHLTLIQEVLDDLVTNVRVPNS